MTAKQNNSMDRIIRVSQLVGVISLIFYLGAWTNSAETKMFDTPAQKEKTVSHLENSGMHMLLKDKEDHFVTRREYSITLKNIEKSIEAINLKINK